MDKIDKILAKYRIGENPTEDEIISILKDYKKLLYTTIEVEYLDFDDFHMREPDKTKKIYGITEINKISEEMKQFDKISSIKVNE